MTGRCHVVARADAGSKLEKVKELGAKLIDEKVEAVVGQGW